jgi:MraZ protein
MFRGRFEHLVDGKGRTSLPAKFREVLAARGDERLVFAPGLERCIVAYPHAEWSRFEERLVALPQFDPSVVRLKRLVVSGAVECAVDRQGRLLLPPALRSHAAIEKAVVWAGMVGHIELWSQTLWSDATRASPEELARLAKALGDMGL